MDINKINDIVLLRRELLSALNALDRIADVKPDMKHDENGHESLVYRTHFNPTKMAREAALGVRRHLTPPVTSG